MGFFPLLIKEITVELQRNLQEKKKIRKNERKEGKEGEQEEGRKERRKERRKEGESERKQAGQMMCFTCSFLRIISRRMIVIFSDWLRSVLV